MSNEPVPADTPAPPPKDPAIDELRSEMADLRAEVRMLEGQLLRLTGMAPPPKPKEAQSRAAAPAIGMQRRRAPAGRRRRDIEALVGRYGTVALGALLLLMGAGVLLSWAVQRIHFTPAARVSLGALGAAIVAGVGVWLRSRGSRPFGGTLLGIALALVHVDAWGAGPSLNVIPNTAALAVAALASAALAFLAWHENDETLFAVGAGGAFAAPFVTAGKQSDVVLLLTYGWVVTTAAVVAVRGRTWKWAVRLLGAAAAGYVLAAMSGDWALASRAVRDGATGFAIACAASALVAGTMPARSVLTRVYAWIAAVALIERAFRPEYPNDVAALAAAGFIALYVGARLDDGAAKRADWLPTIIAGPLVFLAFVVAAPHWGLTPRRAAIAGAWCAAALAGAWDSADMRDALLLVAGLAGAYAIAGFVHAVTDPGDLRQLLLVSGLAAEAAAFGAFSRGTRELLRVVAPVLVLLTASIVAFVALHARTAFGYTPFLTLPSVAALAATIGWIVLALHGRAMQTDAGTGPLSAAGVAGAFASVVAFMWGREELARAFSAEISVFLVVLYFAASGVAAIVAGRRWSVSAARRAGLAVAVYAALKALYQVSDIGNVSLRIGAYVLVGSFLLGVAFLYRATGDQDSESSAAPLGSVSDSAEAAVP